MDRRRVFGAFSVSATLLLVAAGCGGPSASPSPATTTVPVTLQEWSIGTGVAAAPAGLVTFRVTNQGPVDLHELVVIKTDLLLISLPTDANGVVDEEGGGMEVMGEVEDIPVGASQDLSLTLAPGAYVLICNIYEEGEAHYTMGMRTSFTVNP